MKRKRFRIRVSPPPVRVILMLTSIIFTFFVFFTIWIIDKGIKPPLMDIAVLKTREFATRTINSAVKSTENISFDDLMDIRMDQKGNVSTVGWNAAAFNRALRTATDRAEYFLYGMNKGETLDLDDPDMKPIEFGDSVGDLASKDPTVVEIPIGQATGNTILANLGPKIPVHFEIVGSLESDIIHEVKEFGINASLIEIYIPVTVTVQIVIPFSTTTTTISTKVYIDSRVIMGEVPNFYNYGGNSGSSISIPSESFKEE